MPAMRQVSIGFQASMPIALKCTQKELDKLIAALGGDGWHELEGEDATMRLNLAHVLWVRADSEEHRVGFGA